MKRFFRALRPPRTLRVTAPGRYFLALTIGVGGAAINTGNNLLYLALSMNLSLIILSGILSECCLRGLRVRVAHASEAFAARECLLSVTCSAEGKRFRSFSVFVTPGLPGTCSTAWFPEIPPGRSETRIVRYIPPGRGPVATFSCTVSTRFPFSLFEKSAAVAPLPGEALVVYPEPAGDDSGHPGGGPGETTGDRAAAGRAGASIRGAREHTPGDPFRDIHWKASARMAKWMVKERDPDPAQVIEILLPAPHPPEAFERLVSQACGLVLRCGRQGLSCRLRVGDRTLVDPASGGGRKRILSILGLVTAEGKLPEEHP